MRRRRAERRSCRPDSLPSPCPHPRWTELRERRTVQLLPLSLASSTEQLRASPAVIPRARSARAPRLRAPPAPAAPVASISAKPISAATSLTSLGERAALPAPAPVPALPRPPIRDRSPAIVRLSPSFACLIQPSRRTRARRKLGVVAPHWRPGRSPCSRCLQRPSLPNACSSRRSRRTSRSSAVRPRRHHDPAVAKPARGTAPRSRSARRPLQQLHSLPPRRPSWCPKTAAFRSTTASSNLVSSVRPTRGSSWSKPVPDLRVRSYRSISRGWVWCPRKVPLSEGIHELAIRRGDAVSYRFVSVRPGKTWVLREP